MAPRVGMVVALLLWPGAHAPAMPAWNLRRDDRAAANVDDDPATAGLASHRKLQEAAVLPLTAGEKAAFANAHNAERCAVGQDSLNWDGGDQSAATSLAATCSYAKSSYMGLDNGGRGESLYAASFHQPAAQAAVAAVGSFIAEKADWDCSTNSCAGSCEHYTQAVWGATSTLGCAVAHCMSGSPFDGAGGAWTLVVCEYSPAGNTRTGSTNDRPFEAGSCNGASTCIDGAAPDTTQVEDAITADAGAVVAEECVIEADAPDRIDVLVLYTHEAVDAAGGLYALELLVNTSVGDANQALLNSAVDLAFDVTAVELAPSTISQVGVASGIDLLQLLTDSDEVKARRDFWSSDLVSLVAEGADFELTTSWVLGTSSGEPDHGYSVVQSRALAAQQFELARALGHNLGCSLDARHSSVPPVSEYGYGLRQLSVEPYFRTIMASGQDCPGDGCPVLPYYSRHQLSPATCEETAAVGFGTDHDACAAVSALEDDIACSNIMTASLDDADDIGACTYTAAVLASHTFPASNEGDDATTVLIGSTTADCARTIEEQQAVVAQYRIRDDDSCGTGSSSALTLTGIPALPPRDCKNQCSFHGSCDYAAMLCRCRLPWTGDDCSQRLCPDNCNGRGSCDAASGVCKCHGGWTGASCSIEIENFCPNNCAGITGTGRAGVCDSSSGHCTCTRNYDYNLATDLSSDMTRCTSAGGTCWEGTDHSKVTAAPRVEHPIGEVGSITTLNARDESSSGRQGTVESSWQTVPLTEGYAQPVIFVSMPTDNEDTPAAARVRNIRYDHSECGGWCFDVRLQEMNCADDDIHSSESVDYLVIEAGWWESWEGDRIFASVFQTDGAGDAPTYTPVIHDLDLTVFNPDTLYVNAGDILQFDPSRSEFDIWEVNDNTCDWSNSVNQYWTRDATKLATAGSDEMVQWAVPIWPQFTRTYYFTTNSTSCDDAVQRVVAEPLERGCGTGGAHPNGGAAHEHPSHAQDRGCCYGESVLSGIGNLQCGSGDGWVEVNWSFGMGTVPVVLSQVQTYEDMQPVVTRHKDVTASGVKLRMQSDLVTTNVASDHEEELIGLIAFGTASAGRFNRRRFEAGLTTVGSLTGTQIVFREDFSSRPRLFAALQTTAATSSAVQLRMMAVSESVAQSREGDGGATGVSAPLLHDLTPGQDSRSVTGDYHERIPPTETPTTAVDRLTRREARRAWLYTQPRSGSICDNSTLKSCGGDGWGRGIVAPGLRPCGGGLCVVGSVALCEGPTYGRCAATVGGVHDDECNAADVSTDHDTARTNCESAGDCTYTHSTQLGAECAATFAAAGRAADSCGSDCSYVDPSGSCPNDAPAEEAVGYIAFDVGTTGGGTLQAYPLATGPGIDGDCGIFAGPEACNGRGHMDPEQMDRSDCICDTGYFGPACEYASCPRDCSGRGRCQHLTSYQHNGQVETAAGTCVCSDGYYGDGCQYIECPKACHGRGACNANTGSCNCRPPFLPPACAAGACAPACENGGTCDEVSGTCSCAPLFFGKACELSASPPVALESCEGTAIDQETTPNCAAAFADAGGTGAGNCPQGCDYLGSDGTRGHDNKVGRR